MPHRIRRLGALDIERMGEQATVMVVVSAYSYPPVFRTTQGAGQKFFSIRFCLRSFPSVAINCPVFFVEEFFIMAAWPLGKRAERFFNTLEVY